MMATLHGWFRRNEPAQHAPEPPPPSPRLPRVYRRRSQLSTGLAGTPGTYPPARFLQMLTPDYNPSIAPDGRLNAALTRAIKAVLERSRVRCYHNVALQAEAPELASTQFKGQRRMLHLRRPTSIEENGGRAGVRLKRVIE